MSEYLTDRRTGKDSLTSVSLRKARPPRFGTVLVWYRTFPSVPLKRAVGGIGLVPDVPCPPREASLTPRSHMEAGAAERPRPPPALHTSKNDGKIPPFLFQP